MRAIVKEFIEATITDLEAQNYYEMFTVWYNHFVESPKNKDRDNLSELFKIYQNAGLDIYRASEAARKNILVEHMYDYIDDALTYNSTITHIDLPDVIKHCDSDLEISLIDRNELFKEAAKRAQATHNIRLEPFKIVRN